MTRRFPDDKLKDAWMLPEFSLMTHAHHTTKKKLKAKSVEKEILLGQEREQTTQEGYKKGYEAGVKQATVEMNKKIAEVNKLIYELSQFKGNINVQLKEDCLSFITMICEKILMEKLTISTETMLNIVSKALELIDNNSATLKIYCGEELSLLLNKTNNAAINQNFVIEKDDNIDRFCFKAESDKQFLEFNLHQMLQQLVAESAKSFTNSHLLQ